VVSTVRPPRPRLSRLRGALPLAAPFLLFGLLRVPSFLEPHWYTDEAGYVATARAMLRGKSLYAEIWNNKPPLHLWTVAASVLAFGSSEAGLHVLTFLSGLATMLAVLYMGPAVLGRRRTMVALLVVAVLLGAPLFDAELALPESLLIAPATWAMAIVLRRTSSSDGAAGLRWPVAAGVLSALAMAYQQTAIADAAAIGLILVLSPRVRLSQVGAYAATVVAVTAAWVAGAVLTAGAGTVAFALAGFYVAYTQAVLPTSGGGLLAHLLLLAVCLALVLAGAAAARREPVSQWGSWIWAGATLLVVAAAQQPYAHFLAPSVVPVTIAVVGLRRPAIHVSRALLGRLALLAGVVAAALSARVAGVDWVPALASQGANTTRDLAAYYGGTASLVAGGDIEAWQDTFDARVASDRDVAAWIQSHGLSDRTAVVWSADAWPYLLADLPVLMPTAPIYNNEVLLGQQGQVVLLVGELDPELILTSDDGLLGFPEVQPLLDARYRLMVRHGTDAVWVRNDVPVNALTAG
jgi:hypothetical protein